MCNFTWNDVLNHLQSFTPEELNREVQVNVAASFQCYELMTLNGITTDTVFVNGHHHDVPLLEG